MDAESNINYDNGFYDDLMEMIEMALDHRETREQIEEWLDIEVARNIIMVYLRISQFKKSSVKSGEETHWRNLIASLVQNTSLTINDIENLRINEIEDLLEGINENSEELRKQYNNDGKVEQLEGDDAIRALLGK